MSAVVLIGAESVVTFLDHKLLFGTFRHAICLRVMPGEQAKIEHFMLIVCVKLVIGVTFFRLRLQANRTKES